jgi:hypothetical protein
MGTELFGRLWKNECKEGKVVANHVFAASGIGMFC